MPRKLIEEFRRRPDIDLDHSTPIELSDGQEWYFPRPMLEVAPRFEHGKAVGEVHYLTCGELDPLLEAIGEVDHPVLQILAVMTLGAFLLRRNYDLEDEELERLFIYRASDPKSEAMIQAVIDTATGKLSRIFGRGAFQDPKPRAAG